MSTHNISFFYENIRKKKVLLETNALHGVMFYSPFLCFLYYRKVAFKILNTLKSHRETKMRRIILKKQFSKPVHQKNWNTL